MLTYNHLFSLQINSLVSKFQFLGYTHFGNGHEHQWGALGGVDLHERMIEKNERMIIDSIGYEIIVERQLA